MISSISGIYDAIISLGSKCEVAFQLEKHLLRCESLPFDWIFSSNYKQLIKALETKFVNWFTKDNLFIQNTFSVDRNGEKMEVWDKEYDILHVHSFNKNESFDKQYPRILDKQMERIYRFFNILSKANNLLFIRTDTTIEEAKEIFKSIKKIYCNNIRLLIVNHSKEYKDIYIDYEDENITVLTISSDKDDSWQGNSQCWDFILESVKCIREQYSFDRQLAIINEQYETMSIEDFVQCLYFSREKHLDKKNAENICLLYEKVNNKEGVQFLYGFDKNSDAYDGSYWMNNQIAKIMICNKNDVIIKYYNPFFEKGEKKNIALYLNGELISNELLKKDGELYFSFTKKINIIEINISKLFSPIDYGLSDKRELGAIFFL